MDAVPPVSVMERMRRWSLVNPVALTVNIHVLPSVDRLLLLLGRGRGSVSAAADMRILVPVTTGRRTGAIRTTPVAYVAHEDAYYIVGGNWRQPHNAGWTHNLDANPEAAVRLRGRTIPVRAVKIGDDERADVWRMLIARRPPYQFAAERSSREFPVYRLDPAR